MRYVALFRGINVGGKNIVKMTALKQMLTGLGFDDVKTYIQSGNAVFEADESPDKIKAKIQAAFSDTFGFESAVVLRTGAELKAIIEVLPFSPEEIDAAVTANPDVEHVYVYLLDCAPDFGAVEILQAGYGGPDRLAAGEHEVYLLCHDSIRNSKLAASLTKLDVAMTARNLKTLNKLLGMMAE